MFIKRLAASVLAVSFIVPAMLFASCGKAEPKLKDPVKISEDTPWYSSKITTIDTGFDPSDFLFFSSGAVGMIDDLVIFSSGGELLWDPYDFTSAAPSVCTIHVYDIEGNHIYDKDLKEVVSSANPQGDNFLVQNFSIDGDYLKIWARWNEGENLITKVIRYDPKNEQIVSTEDPKVSGDYKAEDCVTLKNTIAAVLGAGRALTLGGEILEDIQVNDVVVGFYSEHFFVQNHFLSGYGSVNLQNVQFHN